MENDLALVFGVVFFLVEPHMDKELETGLIPGLYSDFMGCLLAPTIRFGNCHLKGGNYLA